MKLIKINENNEVVAIHHKPEVANEKQKEGAVLVENIPSIEKKFGKKGILKYDKTTNTVSVEYVDRPLNNNEKLQQLQETVDTLLIDSLGGM